MRGVIVGWLLCAVVAIVWRVSPLTGSIRVAMTSQVHNCPPGKAIGTWAEVDGPGAVPLTLPPAALVQVTW
ncbi:hypothetical protein GCM10027276_05280 [Comamonas piscis]